jgi:entericidin B
MKKIITLFAAFLLIAGLSACNTIEGIGKDAAAAGDAITGSARDNKGY